MSATLLPMRETPFRSEPSDRECGGYIKLDVSEMKDGDTAGLAAFAEKYGYVAVKIEDGKKYIVTVWYDDNDDVEQEFETERVEITENEVYLRVDCDTKTRRTRRISITASTARTGRK